MEWIEGAVRGGDIAWSVFRSSMLKCCPRRYFYHYYGSWNGWRDDVSERVRRLYRLKRLKLVTQWHRELIKNAVDRTFHLFSSGSGLAFSGRRKEAFRTDVLKMWCREASDLSRLGGSDSAKALELFDIYYASSRDIRELLQEFKTCFESNVERFIRHPIFERIMRIDYLDWGKMDGPLKCHCEGVGIWGAPDFVWREGAGVFALNLRRGQDADDVSFAQKMTSLVLESNFNVNRENVVLCDYDLVEGEFHTISGGELSFDHFEMRLHDDIRSMEAYVAVSGETWEGLFERKEEGMCSSCRFKEVCEQCQASSV